MGGMGSGNYWRWSKKQTCEGSLRVDLRYMRAESLLRPGRQGRLSWSRGGEKSGFIDYVVHHHSLELDYRVRSTGAPDWMPVNEHVPLVEVEQPFGGTRQYMRCLRCMRKCLVLYGGVYFRCRKCSGLAYASQSEDETSRLMSRAAAIRKKLGDFGCMGDPFPGKPKRMRWKTYNALEREYWDCDERVAIRMATMIGRLGRLEL